MDKNTLCNAYLKIEGIAGDCQDESHSGWIEVLSFNHGLAYADGAARGQGDRGRCHHQDLSIAKVADRSSPALFQACVDGRHLPEVRLEMWLPGPPRSKLMEIRLVQQVQDRAPQHAVVPRLRDETADALPDPLAEQVAVRVGRQDHALRRGRQFAHEPQKLEPAHFRHALIGDQQADVPLVEPGERLSRLVRGHQLVPLVTQEPPQAVQHIPLVVDRDDHVIPAQSARV